MTDYTNTYGGAAKDAGDDIILGADLDTEFDNIVTAVASKANTAKVEATGDTAAGDNAAMGYTSTEGLILTGQGSSNDITLKNDADTTVMSIATGTKTATFAGDILLIDAASPTITVTDTTNSLTTTLLSDNSAGYTGTTSAHPYILLSNNTTAVTIDSSQNTTFAGTITGSAGNEIDSGLFAIKASDESVSSSTTLQNDDDLVLTLLANSVYEVTISLLITSTSSTPDAKMLWNEADGEWDVILFRGSTQSALNETSAELSQTIVANQTTSVYGNFLVRTGGAGGAFQFQWAQDTSDATATTVQTGSFMKAVLVG